jgi:serine protease AprX
VGEAPGADLVPVKVAGKSGSTNVSTVIQGLQWIADHRSNIRVINMSLGAIPPGPTALNPLDQAVEAMWNNNFVVVTSAGNNGPDRGTITSPGDDPLVITVGALDDKNTVDPADDSVPDFSSNGPTSWDGWWKPDLLAPGKSVVSVISTRSVIWNSFPSARVGKANFVGSGTSFSAAITSGAAALLLSSSDRSPSAVKAALLTTTNAGPGTTHDPWQQGHGVLNIARAVAEPPIDMLQAIGTIPVPVPGPLDLLSTQVVSGWSDVDALTSMTYPAPYLGAATTAVDLTTLPLPTPVFHSSVWNSSEWDSHAWNDGTWDSHAWNDTAWDSHAWNSHAWNSATWG